MIYSFNGLKSVQYTAKVEHSLGLDVAFGWPFGAAVRINEKGPYYHLQSNDNLSPKIDFISPNQALVTYTPKGQTDYRPKLISTTRDFKKTLTPKIGVDGAIEYYITDTSKYVTAVDESNLPIDVWGYAMSHNGEYLLYQSTSGDVFRQNLITNERRKVAYVDNRLVQFSDLSKGAAVGSISNSGKYIYLSVPNRLIVCGKSNDVACENSWELELNNNEPLTASRFTDDETEIQAVPFMSDYHYFLRYLLSPIKSSLPVETSPVGAARITYLALGDSFSSGQGNLAKIGDGQLGYRFGTNEDGSKNSPREKCRISEASYPYQLSPSMGYGSLVIGNGMTWASVACSGAQLIDVNSAESSNYAGQNQDGKPRLLGFDSAALKSEALTMMTPGRQKQIEFVRKYRPKAMTISVGGNDVQFAKIILACVSPNVFGGGEWASECSYAKDDEKKANLAYSILALRNKLIATYEELIEAGSDQTKLYVIGYPVFADIDAPDSACQKSVRLRQNEREMIAESTKFLNSVAKSAAEEAGAIYIDMETSLGQHVLCGASSESAVNGIVLNDVDASFHPNSFGHTLMAERITDALDSKPFDSYTCDDSQYVTCPGGAYAGLNVPEYFKRAINQHSESLNNQSIAQDIINAPGKLFITLGEYTVGPNNPVDVVIYSQKRLLGTYYANTNGGLEAQISLPDDLPYGYHTLEIISKDANGKEVKLWKIVEFRDDDPNDYDGDGVPNDTDLNIYIPISEEAVPTDSDQMSKAREGVLSNASLVHTSVNNDNSVEKNATIIDKEGSLIALTPLFTTASQNLLSLKSAPLNERDFLHNHVNSYITWVAIPTVILLVCIRIYQLYKH